MPASDTALPLRIGARTVWTLRRRLVRRRMTLEEALAGRLPALSPPEPDCDGYMLTGLPSAEAERLCEETDDFRPFVRQRYQRSFARLDLGFDAYIAGFSSKSRSTIKRKVRKLAERSGGALDVRAYRTPDEIDEFHRHARLVSARTYQERLLGAGLPAGPEAVAESRALAGRDRLRAWLLFLEGRPISYLYAPAEGDTLIYAYLGYDPELAGWSPGTVLQLEAMRRLMEEKRFTLFDFTEGEGQHKRQFATGSVDCVDLLLLRRTLANLAIGRALNGFDGAVALAKRAMTVAGAGRLVRRAAR